MDMLEFYLNLTCHIIFLRLDCIKHFFLLPKEIFSNTGNYNWVSRQLLLRYWDTVPHVFLYIEKFLKVRCCIPKARFLAVLAYCFQCKLFPINHKNPSIFLAAGPFQGCGDSD